MSTRLVVAALLVALAQDPRGPGTVEPAKGERIAWVATLGQAREEARRTERPILLLAAAPHCHNVPGIW